MAEAAIKFDFNCSFVKEPCDESRLCETCGDAIFLNQIAFNIQYKIGDSWSEDNKPAFYLCESCYDAYLTSEASK